MALHRTRGPATTPPVAEPPLPVAPAPVPSLVPALIVATIGLGLMFLRYPGLETAEFLETYVSFQYLPLDVQAHVDDLLLVPIGAMLVVFCRVSLGLRMLGPFRPLLIALAFYQTGIWIGALFIAVVGVAVVALRPRLQRPGLPYFGRLALLICTVVVIELVVLMLGSAFNLKSLIQAAVFPIVVLALTADGFARVLSKDGPKHALWRGATTVAIAAAISEIGRLDWVVDLQFEYPEIVLVEIAMILVIATRMRWSLLDRWNPRGGDNGEFV